MAAVVTVFGVEEAGLFVPFRRPRVDSGGGIVTMAVVEIIHADFSPPTHLEKP